MLQPTDAERHEIIKAIFGENLAEYANGPRFKAYFKHYCSVVCPSTSGDAVLELDTPVLKTHADVLNCVKTIFRDPTISFNLFVAQAVDTNSPSATCSLREKERIAKVAVDVVFAISWALRDYHPGTSCLTTTADSSSHHHHRSIIKWEGDVSFLRFIEDAFNVGSPQSTQASDLQQLRQLEMMKRKTSIKAWKLSKRYGIKIRGTDNLLEHLAFDIKTMTLKVFYHVSFLRAHLHKSKQEPLDLNFEQSLKR